MTDKQIIQAPHNSSRFSSDVHEDIRLRSVPVGISSTFYTPSGSFAQTPTIEHAVNVQTVSKSSPAQHISPLQTKVTSTDPIWISPDRYVRSILPRQSNVCSSPRLTLSLQSTAGQSSSNPEPLIPSEFNAQSSFSEEFAYPGVRPDPSTKRKTLARRWIPRSFPEGTRAAPPEAGGKVCVQPLPNRWQQARDYRRKVYEPPYLAPHIDKSIANVELNAEFWVGQLILSVTNTEDVKDSATSHHRRLFSSETIDPLLIEACSREIFTALIDRCKNGFRGPPAFNKALKASPQLESDRTATCEERIQNVVKVLSWNKRACKDVLYEDWKIKLLVNHPLSYDKEKDSQKGSNDQRRRRQLAERMKIESTEEELMAYRKARGEAIADTSSAQDGDGFMWQKNVRPDELHHNINGSLQEFRNASGKRSTYEETGENNAKRQRI